MSKVKNEEGNIYGKLTVIERAGSDKRGLAMWKCQCSCGNVINVRGSDLRNHHTQSCGCIKKDMLYINDLTDQRFGRLVALYPIRKEPDNTIMWHCKCDCGNEKDILTASLTSHATQSCGCLHKEQLRELNFKDLTNQRFGKLIVLYEQPFRTNTGKIIWHCKCDCGNERDVDRNALTSYSTLSCGCLKMSAGEYKIAELLKENDIPFIQEYKPKTLSFDARFDFYIPSKNYLIEFDGEQHFRPVDYYGGEKEFKIRVAHDKEKNQWCKTNDIPLIRIPYTHFKQLCLNDLLLETTSFKV